MGDMQKKGGCVGKHDFIMPSLNTDCVTFSFGVFLWLSSSDGKRAKKSISIVRITGLTSNPAPAYAKAREVVALLDAGHYAGPKNINLCKSRCLPTPQR